MTSPGYISQESVNDLIAFIRARIEADDATSTPHAGERWADSVLAGTAQRRAILEQHAPVADGTQNSWAWFQGSESASELALRRVATTWDEHPAYRREWRP